MQAQRLPVGSGSGAMMALAASGVGSVCVWHDLGNAPPSPSPAVSVLQAEEKRLHFQFPVQTTRESVKVALPLPRPLPLARPPGQKLPPIGLGFPAGGRPGDEEGSAGGEADAAGPGMCARLS